MKLTIKVKCFDQEEVFTTTSVSDFLKWEKENAPRKIGDLANGFGLGDVAFLAWTSLSRAGLIGLAFDQWIETVDELELVESEDPKASTRAR
jgi:hypothetical protein